jgi:uncharacterized protein (TIGR02147 family)
MTKAVLSVFDYIDFRLFLADYYRWQKAHTRGFSHRSMAAALGFTSPNFLKLVMDGDRNIGKDRLQSVAQGLGLNKQEIEYFSYLVFFGQAKTNVDKNYFFSLVAGLRSRKNVAKVGANQYEYFGEWYHPVVRELVRDKPEPIDCESISRYLGTRVSAGRIRKSVNLLVRLGLIELNSESVYVQTSPLVNTENELNTFAIRKYHKEVLKLAQDSIDANSSEAREVSHLTVTISPKGFRAIKHRLQQLREELLQLVAGDEGAKDVFHVNFQLYPVAKSGAGGS